MKSFELINGDSLDVLKTIPDNSVDSVVCDPPYGLSFMGKKWDYDVPSVDIWRECLRVLKPGGHLLAFAGTRTQHRMAVNIEDAGFEIRDLTAWVYGSGFPKSLDISKAIDKAAGAEREVLSVKKEIRTTQSWEAAGGMLAPGEKEIKDTAPATEAAKQWDGWGTALKPAFEPITVARKPLIGTVADNVLKYGTGGLNIDGCRVGDEGGTRKKNTDECRESVSAYGNGLNGGGKESIGAGRFPANLIHDGSEEVLAAFPDAAKQAGSPKKTKHDKGMFGIGTPGRIYKESNNSAARFFYCAKTSKAEREAGLQGFALKEGGFKNDSGRGIDTEYKEILLRNNHPTVKPLALMRYLCRLVTPPGGLVVDPFAGSGSTIAGAMLEGFDAIGIEREADYVEISRARIIHHGGTESEIIDLLNLLY